MHEYDMKAHFEIQSIMGLSIIVCSQAIILN